MPPIHAASELSAMEEIEEMELEEGFGSVSGWRSSEPERRADRMYSGGALSRATLPDL